MWSAHWSTSLQQTAYNALGDNRGAVVVIEPKTGAVLASVSKPDFNPNTVAQDWGVSDQRQLKQQSFKPGNTRGLSPRFHL